MSESLQHIGNFFKGLLSESERKAFEQAIIRDPQFASEVAWYMAGTSAIKEQNLAVRKENLRKLYKEQNIKETEQLYDQSMKETGQLAEKANTGTGWTVETSIKASGRTSGTASPVFMLWKYVSAAAAVMVLILATWYFNSDQSPAELADGYIKTELSDLGAAMSSTADSTEMARQLINAAGYDKAMLILNDILVNDTGNVKALEYAGISALHKMDYTTALVHFRKLLNTDGVYSNPGGFYTALTLMKRNQPGDKELAKITLQTVVQNKAGHYETAEEWLKHW